MGSEYTDNGGIEKIGLGEQAGTWGTTTNNNFDIIDRLINGVGAITLSGTTHTLTTSDGSLSNGMFKVLVLGGSPSGTNTITIDPSNADKLYFVKNASGQSVIFKQGSSGSTVTIANGKGAIIFADGEGDTNGAVTDLSALFSSVAVDGVAIGSSSPSTIVGTTITANTSILPDASGGADIGSSSAEFGDVYIADDKYIKFGNDQDVVVGYDEDGENSLEIKANVEGQPLALTMIADQGDDNADNWKINFADGGTITWQSKTSGSYATKVTIDTSGNLNLAGELQTTNIGYTDGDNAITIADGGGITASTSLTIAGDGATVTGIKDEDNMSSNSATKLATQQSIKAYVDSVGDDKHSAVGNGLEETSASTVAMKNSWITNSATLHSTGTDSSYTNSTGYPVFISGRSTSSGNRSFTVTINGTGKTLDMSDGDSGTYDDVATILPNGASVSVDSGNFTYLAVELRPG